MAKKHYSRTIISHYGTGVVENPDQVGIEIEAEGVPPEGLQLPAMKGWAVHADNSLRQGIELVSAGPRPLNVIDGDLLELQAVFNKIGFVPVFSFRTSLHVHVNVADLTFIQLLNMWTLYTIFESVIMDMGGDERKGNVHCLSVSECTIVADNLRAAFTDDVNDTEGLAFSDAFHRLTSRDRRYASFNWASLRTFGTIEFRSHRGTADRDTVLDWVGTLMALKTAARDRFTDPQTIISEASTLGLQAFGELIFGAGHHVPQNVGQFQGDVWEGIRIAQDVAFSRETWAPGPVAKAKKSRKLSGRTVETIVLDDPGLGTPRWTENVQWQAAVPLPPDPMPPLPADADFRVAFEEARARVERRRRTEVLVNEGIDEALGDNF